MPARYAVYYAPSAGDALHQAVTPLLGRDALGGLNVPQATPPGVDPVFWKAVTRVPAITDCATLRRRRTPPFRNGQPAVALHG
ncbi:MAG: hypothetical protein ACLUDQ_12835 [Bilophila wadsworthia]